MGTSPWEPLLGNLYLGTSIREPGGMGFGAAPLCSETFTMAEDPSSLRCWGKMLKLKITSSSRNGGMNIRLEGYQSFDQLIHRAVPKKADGHSLSLLEEEVILHHRC